MAESGTDCWERGIAELRTYVEAHGHTRVPRHFVTESGHQLGKWVVARRSELRTSPRALSEGRIAELDALGFEWTPRDLRSREAWRKGVAALRAFVEEHGHALVSCTYRTPAGYGLGAWVGTTRSKRRTLSSEQIAELDALGFEWSDHPIYRALWAAWVTALGEFISEHGHAQVPHAYVTPSGRHLGWWVTRVRHRRRRSQAAGRPSSSLTLERIAQLDALGFEWNPHPHAEGRYQAEWEAGVAALRRFVAEHGHAAVRRRYVAADGFPLGDWVSTRRKKRRKGSAALTPERIAELEGLGFIWDSPDYWGYSANT